MSNMLESLQLNIAFFPVITTIKSSTFFILLFMDQVITQRNIRTISNYLCRAGIVFEAFHHEPVLTCEEGKKLLRTPERTAANLCFSETRSDFFFLSFLLMIVSAQKKLLSFSDADIYLSQRKKSLQSCSEPFAELSAYLV